MAPFPARRAEEPEPLRSFPAQARLQPEIEELTERLAEQGIQSTELIVDLVLHDLADEASQSVGANGAAIALEREGELVCRAAAGSTAPDLGIRINTEAGLSGLCVQQGTPQICLDTETDGRVDAEACRSLGVRSIVVLPLFSGDDIIGILEVFASRPHAFSTDDVDRLKSLATMTAQTVKSAREKASRSGVGNTAPPEKILEESGTLSVSEIMQKVTPVDPAVRVLRWLVIGLAIPLIVLIGFDWGWHRSHRPAPRSESTVMTQAAPEGESQSVNAPVQPKPAQGTQTRALPRKIVPPADLASQGGLVVSQNGKVIFREEPAVKKAASLSSAGKNPQEAGATQSQSQVSKVEPSSKPSLETPSLPAGVTGGKLLHSVPPKYPVEAIMQKLEGPVVLHGTVGQDGVIRDLKLVRGDATLSAAALEAVQQWKYEPYRHNGSPIAMPIDITIDFNLPK